MEACFSFLTDLRTHNNREWFQENKIRYQEALDQFRQASISLHAGICSFDPSLCTMDPLDGIFRIYKDVRFSRDKSPYKTHFGCWLTRGGRKFNDAGYYFHLEPGISFMAAGVHNPSSQLLKLIRHEIIYRPEVYMDIVASIEAEGFERGDTEDMLKKGPAGFPKDFPHMEILKFKHHVFSRNYDDKTIMSTGFISSLTEDYKTLHPLVAYLNEAMSYSGNE